jgi:hypothetical protein
MDRRGFLQGLFGGIAAGGVIVTATPEEVRAFATGAREGDPVLLDQPAQGGVVEMGQHLYNARGEVVALITEIVIGRDVVDVTTFHGAPRYVEQSRMTVEIKAVGVGDVEWHGFGLHLTHGKR